MLGLVVAVPAAAAPVDAGLAECRALRPPATARACLERVHAARPRAAALCELGRLEEAAGQPVEAYEAYRRCLAESATAPAVDLLKQARARVAHLGGRLAMLLVRADQPEATVTVDGQPRGAAARGAIPAKPGSRRLRVEAPGCRAWDDIVDATAGEMMEVKVQLTRDKARAPGRGSRPAPVAAAPPEPAPTGPEGGFAAELLLERALDLEDAGASSPERIAAWCDLAVVDGDNPHRGRARARCAAAGPDGEARARLRVALADQQRALSRYLELRRKGEAAKVAAFERFLRTFAALRGSPAHAEAVLAILAQAPAPLRRRICARVGAASLPAVTLEVRPVNARGNPLVGRVFVDGRAVGTAPGSFTVPACAERLGVGVGDGLPTWEQPLPRGARKAEVRPVLARRFVPTGDTVLDTATGRTWQRRPAGEPQPFAGAQRHCQLLPGGGWRLPTRDELLALVERRGRPTIDLEAFPGAPAEAFWTGTAHPDQRYQVWVVSFDKGEASGRFVGNEAHTRCVK